MRRSDHIKFIKKQFSIHPKHIELIEHFLKEKPMNSESDVVRQAIVFFHDKIFPDYVYRETAAGEIKRKEKQEQDAFESMTDEDYALNVLHTLIFDSESGKKFVPLHTIGNGTMTLPLSGLKNFLANKQDIVDFHLRTLKDYALEDRIDKRTLTVKYGIIFPEEQTKTE